MNQCFNQECKHNNKSISGCSKYGDHGHALCLRFVTENRIELFQLREENTQLKEENARLKKLLEQSKRVNKTWKNSLSR